MLWRHLCLVRAWSAAGILTCSLLGGMAFAEPEGAPPTTETETVKVLDAQKSGDLKLVVRGHGQDRVRLSLRNTSTKRLQVILPPGLVAASATGQAGGRGGFQSMGLGAPGEEQGGFGAFQGAVRTEAGFQSVPVDGEPRVKSVAIPVGQTIELAVPAVCLNYGMPTPTPRDKFQLMDVNDFSPDPRVRKALRSLGTIGTSQGVAQAAMWRVANDVPFELMGSQAGKYVNMHEIALAARFVEALDGSNDSELVDPAYLAENRVLVSIRGDGALARDAARLAREFEGLHLLGLPVRVVDSDDMPPALAPALRLTVTLTDGIAGATKCRLLATYATFDGEWTPLGRSTFVAGAVPSALDGASLAKTVDHAVAATFVAVKPAKHGVNSTTLRIDNRLPFTLSNVVVKSGESTGAPTVSFPGLGVGPGRSTLAPRSPRPAARSIVSS